MPSQSPKPHKPAEGLWGYGALGPKLLCLQKCPGSIGRNLGTNCLSVLLEGSFKILCLSAGKWNHCEEHPPQHVFKTSSSGAAITKLIANLFSMSLPNSRGCQGPSKQETPKQRRPKQGGQPYQTPIGLVSCYSQLLESGGPLTNGFLLTGFWTSKKKQNKNKRRGYPL